MQASSRWRVVQLPPGEEQLPQTAESPAATAAAASVAPTFLAEAESTARSPMEWSVQEVVRWIFFDIPRWELCSVTSSQHDPVQLLMLLLGICPLSTVPDIE